MAERYRYRLPDGQVYETQQTPAAIRKQHPDAVIVGRVVMDALGQGVVVPYLGAQPGDVAAARVEEGDAPVVVAARNEAKPVKSIPPRRDA